LVPAKLTPTCIQVLVRLFIVGVISIFPSAQTSVFYSIMATAWAIADIIRYSTYLLESPIVNGKAPFALVWLRYTLFYILYPIGVAGELGILSASIPDVALFAGRAGVLAVAILMILYIPVFPIMYLHMIKLRSKVLGKEEK
jgi:very-long-chain (3R)-3-hydroxyacyl-CoA dehydratase